jgi:hypothetical protein
MKYCLIEFNSVFDAARGIELVNKNRPNKDDRYKRDHDHGVLKFIIDKTEYDILRQNHIGFTILKI